MYSLALQLSYDKSLNRRVVNSMKLQTVKRNTASGHQYMSFAPVGSMAGNQFNISSSEPDLTWRHSMQKYPVSPLRLPSTRNINRTQSQFIASTASQFQPVQTLNGTGQTKTISQIVYSPVDMSKTPLKLPINEVVQKTRGGSG